MFEQRIAEGQKEMANFEQIKKFRLIKNPFSIESGELTSTLKVRRAVILQNYAPLIEDMYANKLGKDIVPLYKSEVPPIHE